MSSGTGGQPNRELVLTNDLVLTSTASCLHLSGKFPCDSCTQTTCTLVWYNPLLVQSARPALYHIACGVLCFGKTMQRCSFTEQHYSSLNGVTDRCLPGPRLTNP